MGSERKRFSSCLWLLGMFWDCWFSDKAVQQDSALSLRSFVWTEQHLQTPCAPSQTVPASSQPAVLPPDSVGGSTEKSFLFKSPEGLVSRRPVADRLLFLGSDRDHKLPQMTCASATLIALLKRRGQIGTIRSQEVPKEVFRKAAAKPSESSQRDLLLLGALIGAPLCAPDMLWLTDKQKGTGERSGLGNTSSLHGNTGIRIRKYRATVGPLSY